MSTPSSRTLLKEFCLRSLGKPVIEINVDDDQLEDRIDDGLQFFAEYHFDGVEKVYLKHVLTSAEITQEYISLVDPVVAVIKIFPIAEGTNSGSIFNIRYQIALNQFYDFSSVSMINFVNVNRHLKLLEQILVGENEVEFNRKQDRLYIPGMNWGTDITVGNYLIIECWRTINPETYTSVYDDLFLKRYVTQLFKLQWGTNLSKFEGIALPGGVTMNGAKIYDDAKEAIEKLEDEMIEKYSYPVDFLIG